MYGYNGLKIILAHEKCVKKINYLNRVLLHYRLVFTVCI